MRYLEKLTLSAIILFLIIFVIISVGSLLKVESSTQNNPIPTFDQTVNTIEKELNNNSNLENKSKIEGSGINSPNVRINDIVFELSKVMDGSFTMDEISKHNSKGDCYLAINSNVYDVSSYISYHPGGSRTIKSRCGKEVTGIFSRIHSNRAWDLLKRYKIGDVSSNSQVSTDQVLKIIFDALVKENPNAEIINVRPKKEFYIAKIIYDGKFYEVHINKEGQIIKEEVEADEPSWSLWENDADDKSTILK